jgi:serine phosphatase RsbU (regulator of sigma subunit)
VDCTVAELARLVPDIDPTATLYVADERLRIVFSNEEWRSFAMQNAGEKLTDPSWDSGLLDNMSGSAKERWAAVYGLLLDKRLSHYEEDFICSSPQERRIFRLRITPVESPGNEGTWLVHHTVRIDDSAAEREDLRRRLRQVESDVGLLERVYRTRVLERETQVPGFQVAEHFQPLEEVGGDLIWSRQYTDGSTDLVVADTTGHGYEAAVHAAKLVMMLDQLADAERTPQDLLATLNRGLIRNRPKHESAFATGIYFRFEQGGSRIRCANFGHMGPLFSRTGELALERGVALGVVDTIPVWPETTIDLDDHGTRFLVYSDGISEQFDLDGTMYGTKRLLRAFEESLELDLNAALGAIVADVDRFRGEAIVKDDLTLVALELHR